MKEKNNRNIFLILKKEIVLFFKSILNGISFLFKYGPFSIIYFLSFIATFIYEKFKSTINAIKYFSRKLVATIYHKIYNSKILTNHRKKKEASLRVLTIDKLDSKRNKKKVIYEYLARIPQRDITKGYYSAHSSKEVYDYLIRNGYIVYKIKTGKWVNFAKKNISYLNNEIEEEDMLKWLAHLTVSLKKNISYRDAFMTIAKNNKKKKYRELLDNIIKQLIKGETLSNALSSQGNSFPDEIIELIRKAEYNDNVSEAINEYLEDKYKENRRNNTDEASGGMGIIFLIILCFAIYKVIQYFVFNNNMNIDTGIELNNINQNLLTIIQFLKDHYIIVIIIIFIILVIL
jgi:hypothetical protein